MASNFEPAVNERPDSSAEPNQSTDAFRMEVKALPFLNYAMQQNGLAAVRSVTVENRTDADLENIELRITATPSFALPLRQHIDLLPANQTVVIEQPKLVLDAAYLAAMTEKVRGVLHIGLYRGDEVLVSAYEEITVLAFDEWHGLGLYPELLAAFVTPNHPQIARIIARATEFLGQWTGDTSMDAYQSQDPNRVLSQAAAIYAALKEQSIAYAVPPASFETAGQRVRLCDMVLQQKLGTCLDLTLLYAACLESVGLHPLLITTVGHIFTGVWLEERMFPECVQDDASLITKRLASGINEIAVVETTCVASGRDSSFDEAGAFGEKNLTAKQVEYIIDVRRARLSHISPLPHRIQTAQGWSVEHTAPIPTEAASAPRKLDEAINVSDCAPQEEVQKKVQWERKLLDLGLRNTLINLRLTKTQLPILSNSLDELENALADGSDFTVMPRPAEWSAQEMTFETLHEMGEAGIIQAEFENKRLRTVLTEAELSKTIKELYRSAKTALEENGANTLYLALGMLRWFENKRSTKPRYAPIILLPIEMIRKSAAQGYVIRLRDDDAQMNVTLLEKLKQDFGIVIGGLDPLPTDDHGIDIRKVLTVMRKAVMEQSHWDVLEAASIGIFSFSQFVMWNDIRNRTEDLMRNKIVRSLMEGKLTWQAEPLEIGEHVNEDHVLLPMPADASQLYAIETACKGESFVLHGPPGTGKSQTITSLIANALANGKRVLFVAEKMAALEVVQKRLDRIGIGPFCLELHSNKSKKKDVLEQLRQASEVTKTKSAEDFAAKADQLASMRRELDAYAQALHRGLPCGSDLYTLINAYEACKDAPDIAPFARDFLRSIDAPTMEQLQLLTERLIAAGKEVGHPKDHPLSSVRRTEYSQTLRTNLQTSVENYRKQAEKLSPHVRMLAETLQEEVPSSYEKLSRLSDIAGCMICWYDLPKAWPQAASPLQYLDEVQKMAQHFQTAKALQAQLLQRFRPDFLTQDAESLHAEYVKVAADWFLPRFFGMRKLLRRVNVFAKTPVDKASVQNHLQTLREYQNQTRAAELLLQTYAQELGSFYSGQDTDWVQIGQAAAEARLCASRLYEIYGSHEVLHRHCGSEALREAVAALNGGMTAFLIAKNAFDSLLEIEQCTQAHWLDGQIELCRSILEHADEMKEWTAYTAIASQAETMGLGNVADSYAAGMAHEDVLDAFRKALLRGLISDEIDRNSVLNRFSGAVFNKKIEQYKRMDEQWAQLSQQEIYCRLASKVPNFTKEAAHSSELGILQRSIKSGGRGVSIRKLFEQIPNLLPRLCPCMLMSPISAAQYLDPKTTPFDIVVFDEASQLPTCKAVGVLARGIDAIIVGDPKQMPPTSFFATNTVDEDNLETEDLESILDDCLALNMPQSHLLWHYRSRHESLIAFSNSRFYENKLYTFPSVNDRESKVRLIPVDGFFDRGKSRRNQAEAEAIIQELRRRCHDAQLRSQSVGVVTFNISQQHLIDDLLNEACKQDPELEKWAFTSEEPVFIKNLENVQGDERDVILFSVGYGPDENGKVYMNFGPLNRDGGWRRLNVAVSRARCEMMVFSTLRADQIDLNRTKSEGVAALRAFLEYAEGRPMAVSEAALKAKTQNKEALIHSICKALEEQGYETDRNVGRSEYRIDIGVVNPEQKDQYLLGIMLDGASYGAAKTTRDREVAQIGVLSGLGWNILRVWCMDWWDNSDKELKRIFAKLKELKAPKKEPPTPAEVPQSEPAKVPAAPSVQPAPSAAAPMYQAANLTNKTLTAEEFTEPKHLKDIQKRITTVINAEAPISESLLIKRVVQSCGISRAGSRIQNHMSDILIKMSLKSDEASHMRFYWREDQDPNTYLGFRVSADGENRRDVREVAVQETANALYTVLYEQISMGQDDLLRETAKKLGYTRLGGNVLSVLEEGIRYAERKGGIALSAGGNYVLTEKATAHAQAILQSFESSPVAKRSPLTTATSD